jgi:cob(I)alamin adenosyltransferase
MTDRIYTRTGDAGETGLFGGGRVAKSDPRVEAYGVVDELNAQIGWAIGAVADSWIRERLATIQSDLFTVGAHLATPPADKGRKRPAIPDLPGGRVAELEAWMDEADASLPPLRAFILPGGSAGSAALHVCRCVCRRAERSVVRLSASQPVEPLVIVLLNRLSDFLFVAARRENANAGIDDVKWDPADRSAQSEGRS